MQSDYITFQLAPCARVHSQCKGILLHSSSNNCLRSCSDSDAGRPGVIAPRRSFMTVTKHVSGPDCLQHFAPDAPQHNLIAPQIYCTKFGDKVFQRLVR